MMGEKPFIKRDVFDADNALVSFEFSDAVNEQEWVAMRQDSLDCSSVERKPEICCHRVSIVSLAVWMG